MKKTSLLFAICILIQMILFGCYSNPKQDDTNSDVSFVTDESTVISDDPIFEKQDYEGYEFRILARDNNWDRMEVDFDETNADPINNAVYQRNSITEELYNLKVTGIMTTNSIYNMVKKSVMSGGYDYDLILTAMAENAVLAKDSFLAKWNKISSVDLSNPWWDQNIVKDLSINGNIYFMTGDFNVRDNDNTWIILFNKKMHENLILENIYDIVNNQKWTINRMMIMAKIAINDMDGNGIFNEDDCYGLISTTEGGKNFFYAAGEKVIEKDAAGYLILKLNTPNAQLVIEKVYELFNVNNYTYLPSSWEKAESMFASDKSLFYGEIVTHIINLRNMETDFGILPTPKLTENQENYYTHIASNGTALSLPSNAFDLVRSGTILEAMSYYGMKYLTPAFNEVSLKTKFARDDESADMLDIISKSVRYDIGYLYNIGGLADVTTILVLNQKSTDLQSFIEKNREKAEKDIEKLIKAFDI